MYQLLKQYICEKVKANFRFDTAKLSTFGKLGLDRHILTLEICGRICCTPYRDTLYKSVSTPRKS